jgi:hypothetical protein
LKGSFLMATESKQGKRPIRTLLALVFCSVGAAAEGCSTSGAVTTLAGSGSEGFVDGVLASSGSGGSADGVGATASFNFPYGVSYSGDGSLIAVADNNNHMIRIVVVATKEVSTLAGSGSVGSADGVGAAASFNSPRGVSFSGDASLIAVADTANHMIRIVVAATGEVSTLAGMMKLKDSAVMAGSGGFSDGVGAAASFIRPTGVSFSGDGALLAVADTNNNRILVWRA